MVLLFLPLLVNQNAPSTKRRHNRNLQDCVANSAPIWGKDETPSGDNRREEAWGASVWRWLPQPAANAIDRWATILFVPSKLDFFSSTGILETQPEICRRIPGLEGNLRGVQPIEAPSLVGRCMARIVSFTAGIDGRYVFNQYYCAAKYPGLQAKNKVSHPATLGVLDVDGWREEHTAHTPCFLRCTFLTRY